MRAGRKSIRVGENNVQVLEDGALYCDLSALDFECQFYTTNFELPIKYSIETWEALGKAFVDTAQSTCPVDTGFLRDHHSYAADYGGCEMISEAPYSAYQEYGTSRYKGQPWFEKAVQTAIATTQIAVSLQARYQQHERIDAEMMAIMAVMPGKSNEAMQLCMRMENLMLRAISYDFAPEAIDIMLYYYYELVEQYNYLVRLEEMSGQGGGGGGLGAIFIFFVVIAILTLVSTWLSDTFGFSGGGSLTSTDRYEHHRTREE